MIFHLKSYNKIILVLSKSIKHVSSAEQAIENCCECDKSINEKINVSAFGDSLVSLLQPLDLPLQFKVVGATRRHPTEEQNGGEEEEELLMKSKRTPPAP